MRKRPILLLLAAALVLPAGDQAPEPLTPPEWLATRVSLHESDTRISAYFGAAPARMRVGELTTFSFVRDPEGVAHSHESDHNHATHAHGEADACNLQPAWSITSRNGEVQSIIANPEAPVALSVLARHGLREAISMESGGILVKAWAVRKDELLVAIGVDPKNQSAGQWVLIRRSVVPAVYPELAARLQAR